MCGIIGFAGNTEAFSVLLDGLKRLEYRGYEESGKIGYGRVRKDQ